MSWDWIYYLLLVALLFTGLFVNILGLPGLWLMVIAHAMYGWITGWSVHVGWASLIIITVLALLAELVEFLAGAAGSKAAGGSKRGMAGAIIGGIVGGILGSPIFPIVGTILGAVVGAGVGAFAIEKMIGRTHGESVQIAVGAAKGRFWGIIGKSIFGIAMLFVSVITALPTARAATPPVPAPVPLATPPTTDPATLPSTMPTTVPVER